MNPAEVIEDFLLATFNEGDLVRVSFADGSVLESTDTAELVDEIVAGLNDDPWLDLVDGSGNAHGLFLPGDPTVVDPCPSFAMDGGMVYILSDGNTIPDEDAGKHMLPVSVLLDTIDWQTFAPTDLSISTPGSEMEIVLSQGRNRMEKQGAWKPLRSVFGQFSDALQKHVEGKKDGPCFLQGECAGGTRKAAAMVANYIIGVDLDSGAPLDDVMDTIIEAGLEAVVYTTHSHLKDTSQIKRDHFLKWADGESISPELCAEYLMQVKGVIPEIAKGVEIVDESLHTEEGIVILVRHQPMPKFRAVFPLSEPFIFARRGGTQQDAISEWKERYAGFASAMGFFFDETCIDPARLFYLPRHKRGDAFGSWWIAGKPVDLDNFDRVKIKRGKKGKRIVSQNAFSNFAGGADEDDDRDRYVVNGESLVPWAKKVGKVFEIEEFLTEHCPDMIREPRSGKPGIHVECPFEAEHSSFGGGGTYIVNASDNMADGFDGGFTFHCVHNACQGRDRLDFLKGCIEEEWFSLADLQDKRYRVELEDDEEEDEAPPPRKTTSAPSEDKEPVYEEAVDDGDEETRMLQDFNRRYAVVVNGGAVKVMREPVLEDDDYQFLTQSDVSLLEKNKIIYLHDAKRNKTERIEAFKQWLEWEKRRTYQGVVFAPGSKGGDQVFNLFRGFPIEPLKGDWSLLRGHIYENICESDDDLFDWFMTWMAQLVQQPDRKPGSTLVVTGEKGTGKSTTFDYLGMLLGRHSITVSQRKQIVGNFNAHIATALLMVCEEAFWAADPQAEGVLKDMITNKHTLIEKKGYDPIKSQNYTRLVLISNSDWVVPASLKDERRFGVYRCSDRRRGDIEFFEALRHQMEYEGGLQAMMYELLHYKPMSGSFGILFTPPKTRYLQRQQVETLTGVDRFMLELMRTGVYESTNDNIDPVELEMDKETLVYAVNLRSCVEDYVRMRFASEKAKTSYDDISTVAAQWFGATESMLLVEGAMNKKRALRFPPLREAREALKERTGLEIDFMEVEVASMAKRS
jgi:hypothetical protein